uniref:Uncharacterized protein n=1 Tax=Lepeophtheirus salmonis TaxID=72036 RepID=A0A0K2V0F3_LEPSM
MSSLYKLINILYIKINKCSGKNNIKCFYNYPAFPVSLINQKNNHNCTNLSMLKDFQHLLL